MEEIKESIIRECSGYYDLGKLKSLFSKPRVFETSELCIPDKNLDYQGGVALGPFVEYQLFILLFIVFPVAIIVNYYLEENKHGGNFMLVLIILYAIGFVVYKNIKSLHREIKIDRAGITMTEGQFLWKDLYGTFIMTTTASTGLGGSVKSKWLIVVDKRGVITKHEITFLSCPINLLATIIEYYKATPLSRF